MPSHAPGFGDTAAAHRFPGYRWARGLAIATLGALGRPEMAWAHHGLGESGALSFFVVSLLVLGLSLVVVSWVSKVRAQRRKTGGPQDRSK